MIQRITILLIFLIIISCKKNTIQPSNQETIDPLEILKKEFPSDKYEVFLNENEDHAIVCSHFPKNDRSGFSTLILKVFDIKNQEVIYEERVPKGKTFWLSNDIVGIQSIPGIVQNENDGVITRKYNVQSRSFLKE